MTKSYGTRGLAAPLNHKVYKTFIDSLGLSSGDHSSLAKRGLTSEQISKAGYATKLNNASNSTVTAIGAVRSEFGEQLEGIAGFYQHEKTGHWTCSGNYGILIPVRDMEGNITQLVLKNASPIETNGRITNKYITFSSAGKPKGAKVWQQAHCPIVNGKTILEQESVEIRITEGVLKADVATALGRYYCIGLQGLKLHDNLDVILDRAQICKARISLDSGEDENSDMIRIKCTLINHLRDLGIEVVVEKWNSELGKGVDDVIKAGHEDKIEEMTEEEIQKLLEIGNAENPLNGEWIYLLEIERFININNQIEFKKSQFTDCFGLQDIRIATEMIGNGIRKVKRLTYEPAQEMFIEQNGISYYNMWVDPKITAKKGDVKKFTDHMDYIFDGKGEYIDIFLDWMAYHIQNPGIKILWALVIIGDEGIGKSFFAEVMKSLLGKENVSTPTNEEIHEIYTGWLKRCQLVIIEEIMARGRRELMNKLKPIITQEDMNIREMHKPTYRQTNRANILAFTNYIDSLPIDEKDRRYCFLNTSVEAKGKEYYLDLWDWLRNPSTAGHLKHFLMARDVSKFVPTARAPMTDAKDEIIKVVRSPIEQWIISNMEDEAWPFNGDLITIRHLKMVLPKQFSRDSDRKISQALEKAGARNMNRQIKLSDSSSARLWSLRRHDLYAQMESEDLAKRFEKGSLLTEPGNNVLGDQSPF